MFSISIDTLKCEGDGDCVDSCPATVLALVDAKATVTGDPNDCLGCMACVTTCKNEAIAVQEF
ncbi:2-oxoglutarate ferredoxin oxidoreductase subunit delta [Anaerolineae bacterium]|nr:2-oxoglutarate ferredoxin oxidoreductase subunit delta [Anaerolineae bacterium]